MSSYHDVTAYVGNVAYRIADNYALQLHCTRTAGWQLWRVWKSEETLLGGEFDGAPFCITVGSRTIVGRKPTVIEQPPPFGWDGIVYNPQPADGPKEG